MTPPTRLVPRYLGQRLDGDLDQLHRALAFLAADTCAKGRCDPAGPGQCGRHAQRDARRALRAAGGS
jgi:hypothetical protein